MTRFARAKGSKSSNERMPEDSTPWEVMKEQLLQAKKDGEESTKREQAEKQRIENYENFLKEHKTQKRKATWCDFPESQISILSNLKQASEPVKKKSKKQSNASEQSQSIQPLFQNEVSEPQQTKKKSKEKKHKNTSTTDSEVQPTEVKEINQRNESKKGKKKNKKQEISVTSKDSEEHENVVSETGQSESKGKKNKKHKLSKEGKTQSDNQQNSNNRGNEGPKNKQKKKKMLVNGEPARRKPVNDNSFQLIINGKEIELVRYDGFPIMKKDAERLQELRTSMIKKGIPKSEVQRTMKLERRRAEKALARVKRDVCYNCRKGGHNLSDCPELKTKIPGVGAPDGLCFKCGSTEHRQFECKVQRDKEFRFATCFICKEPGHIARQCPDNPKGLYPNGGSCNLCGDVTHLRKDCPTVQDKREDSSIKLQTLDSGDLESMPQKTKKPEGEEQVKKPKKITF